MTQIATASSGAPEDRRRACTLYIPGHEVHYIQALRSSAKPTRTQHGAITSLEPGLITVDFDGTTSSYRNHQTERLQALIAERGAAVYVDEGYSILKVPVDASGGRPCFSIARAGEPWRECDYDELRAFDAESVTEWVRTHGGFTAPAALVRDGVMDSDDPGESGGSEVDIEGARRYIDTVRWTFARTMPQWPHEYTVRQWRGDLEQEFEAFAALIRAEGVIQPWPPPPASPRYHHTYLAIGRGSTGRWATRFAKRR